MRTLVLSDIHGNLAALSVVAREPYDAVICLGDIVGYGPAPAACVRWIRESATWVIQGNHDRAAAENVPPLCRPDFAWLAEAVAPLTRSQLGMSDLNYLRSLPHWAIRDLGGVRVACFHAKPSDPLYGYLPPNRDMWARELEKVDAELVFVGHTHLPLDLTIGNQRLVNPGSVGQPKDGDPRAAFAVFADGEVELKRASYPVEKTIAAFAGSNVDARAIDVLGEMLRKGTPPRMTEL